MADLKTPTTPAHASFGCKHIKDLLSQQRDRALGEYSRLIQTIRNEGNITSQIYTKGGASTFTTDPVYLCIQCTNVSKCRERHRSNHPFSVESKYGYIFCHDCKDFIYDATFEEIRSGNSKKRKRPTLSAEEQKLIAANTTPIPCAATGLRGLYNMGQTCFMSVILQSLIHNPFIRAFYLSEGHKKEDCAREACTACALDDMFNEFTGEVKREGYGAVNMLQGCWKDGGSLAGYSQQDAHEFLGFLLNSLHTAIMNDDNGKNVRKCPCVVHTVFGGWLKSTVTCSGCKNITTALDPFMDLSLDIKSVPVVKKKKLAMINGTSTVKEIAPMDLSECLDRFTSTEILSAETGSYNCRHCSSPQEVKKQFSISRLPPVIPIHLKRFSHSKSLKESSKVETKIRFPSSLDLTPYTTSSASRSKSKTKVEEDSPPGSPVEDLPNGNVVNSSDAKPADDDFATRPTKAVYDLNSVVVHKGKIDNGHYISYSRQQDEWYRFDDSMVVQVDEREVLGAEAYMLFYVIEDIGD